MRDFILGAISKAYERIFQEEISPEIAKFLKNLGYIGIGSVIGALFSLIFQTQAGRILGPSLYGEYTLVESVSGFLSIPMLVGITGGLVRYNAAASDKQTQSSITSTTFFLFLIFCLPSTLAFFLLSSPLSRLFSVSINIYRLAIAFAALSTLFTLTTDTFRGLFQMKKLALIRAIHPLCLLLVFFATVNFKLVSFNPAVFSTYLAFALTSGIILFSLRGYLSHRFISRSVANTLIRYGGYGTIGITSGALAGSADKLLINYYLTTAEVGIYRAYYFASLGIVSMFMSVFITVFFPTASKFEDKEAILQKIKKFTPYAVVLGLPAILCIEFFVLKFYGKDYPINLDLLLLFAVTSTITILYTVYAWFVSSFGLAGAKVTAFTGLSMSLLNVGLNVLWIPSIGVMGAILATCITSLCSLAYYVYKLKGGIKVG